MGKIVKVGSGQGFYGDTIEPAVYMAEHSDVQYICFDTLAELTLAILQKDRQKDPTKGYPKDITNTMRKLLPFVKEKGIKLITNAGGINPEGAKNEVLRVAKELGITGIKVGVVTGDDIYDRIDEFQENGIDLKSNDSNEDLSRVREKILFASVYLGAQPIAEALNQGADIVITGRTTDTAQFLGPLIYEFGWEEQDWDKLASGILVGHLLECSGQGSGGNFSGDWYNVENLQSIGYPIAEVNEDGSFIVTKTVGSGGRVSIDTIKEQFLYEIHDPSTYITPDVIADFTTTEFEEIGENRVLVKNTTGRPAPPTLKALMGYKNGFLGQGMIGYSWPQALSKARAANEIIRSQIETLGIKVLDIHTEYLGYNALHGPLAQEIDEDLINEIFLKITICTEEREEATKLAKLFPPLTVNGPPYVGMISGLSPSRELLGLWSTLIPRETIESNINIEVFEVI
ncbi:acyclic terpene utilization AtuA family protein [Neobacillus niacini]|uniref:acyclic terpene utilization AtuA family protein n=1 Tax=Neobacillus niacini TaxID=86668 RepID=UPI002FFF61F3